MPQPDVLRPGVLSGLSLLYGGALLWPAFLNGGPLLFPDSLIYVDQGRQAVEGALALLVPSGPAEGSGAASFEAAASSATYIRSLSWSGFAYVGSVTPLALFGPILLQSVLASALVLLLLVPAAGAHRLLLAAALAVLALFTSLPWFASFLMPDILAAVLILAGMLLVQVEAAGSLKPWRLAFVALAVTFAVASHYGFMPLGAVVAAAVLAVLLVQGRMSGRLAVVAVAPLLIAVGANMAASEVAFDTADVAPKRLPILLARSIEDGPGTWYLKEACPEAGYVLCRHLADMPTTAGGVLWGSDSLLSRLSDEELETLRAEEAQILVGAFRAYPLEQGWALAGNAFRQLSAIGTSDFHWDRARLGPDGKYVASPYAPNMDRTGLEAVARVQAAVVLLSIVAILAFAVKDRLTARPDERALLFMLAVGLLANAAIFGGLSAPVDRYQGRVIWLLPMLAMLFGLNRHRKAVS